MRTVLSDCSLDHNESCSMHISQRPQNVGWGVLLEMCTAVEFKIMWISVCCFFFNIKLKVFVPDSAALWRSGGCCCQLGRYWMGFERNEKGGTSTVCMSHHLLLTPPSHQPPPHATHTPTSQTAYFVLQVRDLQSNVFMAGKIYLSIKPNAGIAFTTQTQQASGCELHSETNCRCDAERVQTLQNT